jgi:DNA-binding MarR family transcriptional regulator
MSSAKRTSAGTVLSDVILDVFRLNNRLTTAGDRLVSGLGLTSARWQILGAVVNAERKQSVAWLARDLGGNRQNVQRIVNDLLQEGMVALQANPHHRRSPLIVLTDKGKKTYDAAMRLQAPWINGLADGLLVKDIDAVRHVVRTLRDRLENAQDADSQP